ncbi:ABC transporter substrate-binding protein [Prescottella agglutinans]|uniref:ABC transporter substrate-binding protein n=1 Tax=Prescottella agglutinans TaxID=1644129 RepID=A0A3S3BSW8_9NOCA|nr:ABC transporter substrate-binding protein [Prescottella agglutinans]RVW08484.1 ABC transporter substrate-binding protein [Prescottella agglutinans]
MNKSWCRSSLRLAALVAAATTLVAGCASADGQSNDGASVTTGMVNVAQDAGDPVRGGTVTFGSYSFPNALDPTRTQAAGSTGGTEMAAIYDTLLRTDPESGTFEPQLAEALEHNADYTEFTVRLRDGATFSDGSPVDADAVKWSIDRFVAARADVSQVWANSVTTIGTPDAKTVTFTLNAPWDRFPVLLAMGPGMVVSKNSDTDGKFTPIGAGPFTLTRFAPNEEIVLTAREDYWNGRPNLDKVRFVPTNGARGQLESLQSGQLDMAYILRDEATIRDALNAGYGGYLDVQGLGALGMMNTREGRPGADLRVRQAVAYGVDPQAINQRANDGLGIAGSTLVPDSSRWSSGAEGVPFDPDKARQFLNEAKADGYDGKLTYLSPTEKSAEAAALAVQASLNSIGFDVRIEYVNSVTDLVRKLYVEHDFDMTRSAFAFMDESPYLRLYGGLGSESRNNASGYADPQMDALLVEVKTATTDEAKKNAIAKVQARANETIPYAVWGPSRVLTVWDDDVHGVKRTADNILLLDGAWIGQ